MGSTLTTPIFELYRQQFNLSDQSIAIIFAAYVAGVIVSLLVSDVAARRWGHRAVTIVAVLVSLVAALFFLLAETAISVGIARVLSGISVGLCTATLTTMMRASLPATSAAICASVGLATGLACGPLLAEVAILWLPDPAHSAFWLYLPFPTISLLLMSMLRPTRSLMHLRQFPVPETVSNSRRVILSTATLCCAFALNGYYLSLVPSLLQRDLATTHPLAVLAVTILLAAAAMGQALVRHVSVRLVEYIGLALLAIGSMCAAILIYVGNGPAFIICTGVLGLGHGMTTSSSLAALNTAVPSDRSATATVRYYIFGYLASALPIIGLGWLSDQLGLNIASITFFLLEFFFILACYVRLVYLTRPAAASHVVAGVIQNNVKD
ncbi:MFS family permease [Glaciimonas immobilis]|uniref:MFS family permease n=2 Tax=Glaciimonas immobilis TaxID=728004 RepID=A0A840RTT6_9BURK|nr:MFS transporter [Glaciimonas immobilis]MBB5199879.1 MFS family permease [Glaciimonas immobilis]